jgi:hypothetical protein
MRVHPLLVRCLASTFVLLPAPCQSGPKRWGQPFVWQRGVDTPRFGPWCRRPRAFRSQQWQYPAQSERSGARPGAQNRPIVPAAKRAGKGGLGFPLVRTRETADLAYLGRRGDQKVFNSFLEEPNAAPAQTNEVHALIDARHAVAGCGGLTHTGLGRSNFRLGLLYSHISPYPELPAQPHAPEHQQRLRVRSKLFHFGAAAVGEDFQLPKLRVHMPQHKSSCLWRTIYSHCRQNRHAPLMMPCVGGFPGWVRVRISKEMRLDGTQSWRGLLRGFCAPYIEG